jgi:hypothetical protein
MPFTYSLNAKQRKDGEIYGKEKWLEVNEDIPFKKTERCTKINDLRNLRTFYIRLDVSWNTTRENEWEKRGYHVRSPLFYLLTVCVEVVYFHSITNIHHSR